jgi:undecaprenyl-diphosphatase
MGILFKKMNAIDTRVFIWVNTLHAQQFERLLKNISHTGDGFLYLIISVFVLLFVPEGDVFFIAVVTAYVLEVPIYIGLKNLIKRDRPEAGMSDFFALIKPNDRFSFPSGHTAAAFVFAVLISHSFPSLSMIAFVWAGLIGLSRILLGVHYPGDIVAGSLLGVSCAKISLFLI